MKSDEILIKTFDQVKNDNFDQVKFDQVIVCPFYSTPVQNYSNLCWNNFDLTDFKQSLLLWFTLIYKNSKSASKWE